MRHAETPERSAAGSFLHFRRRRRRGSCVAPAPAAARGRGRRVCPPLTETDGGPTPRRARRGRRARPRPEPVELQCLPSRVPNVPARAGRTRACGCAQRAAPRPRRKLSSGSPRASWLAARRSSGCAERRAGVGRCAGARAAALARGSAAARGAPRAENAARAPSGALADRDVRAGLSRCRTAGTLGCAPHLRFASPRDHQTPTRSVPGRRYAEQQREPVRTSARARQDPPKEHFPRRPRARARQSAAA